MKIAIDARWIFAEISGIGEYTRQLIRHLALADSHHTFLLLFNDAEVMRRTVQELDLDAALNMQSHVVPYGVFSPMSQLRLPAELRRLGADLYHSTNYMMPLPAFPRRGPHHPRGVVTIHDVIPLMFPNHAPRSRKARVFPLYRALMKEIGLRADRIVTVSTASAADIARTLGLPGGPAGKIRAIYNGVSGRFRPPSSRPRKGPETERRILYVGRSDPYKNLPALVDAFALARKQLTCPSRLLIAGSPDPRYPEAGARAVTQGVADSVQWTGYVSDDALVRLYQDADVLVHPSRYEGFGLQVAEAMACGLPVVCSNAGALPEVAGDAALQFAPDDVPGFAQAIVRVLTEPDLAETLGGRGLERARQFTWAATASHTLRVYEELGAAPAE